METASHSQRILIVDDNLPLREVMAIMLKDEGYEVSEASDGESALKLLLDCEEQNCPSCIVLDVMMPHMNGDELLKQITKQKRNDLKNIPVVVYSAEGLIKNHPQIKARLQKPVSIELLFSAIRGCSAELH